MSFENRRVSWAGACAPEASRSESPLPACRTSASSDKPTGRSPDIHSQQERRSPAGARAGVAAAVRVATLHSHSLSRERVRHPHAPLGIKTEHAFADCALRKSTTREALALRSASRHPGRSTLPREPCSLRRASGFSHEYLLLSPRSALAHVPARTAPGLRHFSL